MPPMFEFVDHMPHFYCTIHAVAGQTFSWKNWDWHHVLVTGTNGTVELWKLKRAPVDFELEVEEC